MIRWLKSDWGRYCSILGVWTAAYFLPVVAMENSDWYGEHFHVYQSVIPCLLIFAVYHLSPLSHHWRENLSFIFILQILHNLGDVVFDDSWQAYDLRQAILNGMELSLLVGWGLPALLLKTLKAHRMRRDSRLVDHNHDSRDRLAQNRKGLSGHV